MEKVGVSGKKEAVRGDSGSSLRRKGKEPVGLGGGRSDGALDAKGWSKLVKIACRQSLIWPLTSLEGEGAGLNAGFDGPLWATVS